MSHRNDDLRHNFLRNVDVGDEIWIKYDAENGGGTLRVRAIEGYVASQNFYYVRISEDLPEKVVAEQQRKIKLGKITEYGVLNKRY